MMSLWDALRMNMMISYQELVRTFLKRACMNCSTHKAIPLTFSCEVATGTGVPVKVSDCCTLPG
ncbi:hypothetical protein B4U25_02790 [Klebsiella pneumoniae]|nr:hypothetical protein [Klebsiella pneumoniae subsp. pneumoniae]PVW68703.1 hypothetical protein B4U28_02200 [Klebsiella pneumoniae]PVW70543.1 hypothetical protein B4U27_02800 [Klebsiella pneumoniae]PVW88799.1 hypothetical protein B4U25_02790 [Klebsiella pneumoniae]